MCATFVFYSQSAVVMMSGEDDDVLVGGGKVYILFTGSQLVATEPSNSTSRATTSYSPSGR